MQSESAWLLEMDGRIPPFMGDGNPERSVAFSGTPLRRGPTTIRTRHARFAIAEPDPMPDAAEVPEPGARIGIPPTGPRWSKLR